MRLFFVITALILAPLTARGAVPDTLTVFDAATAPLGEPGDNWEHVRPKDHRAYTGYSVVRSVAGNYLRIMATATGSWLEYDLGDVDVAEYPVMDWNWMVTTLPETEWEGDKEWDDFAIRIELVYDFKGGKNPMNLIRKGFIDTLFRGYPPELVISYVWSVNVPIDKPYRSPSKKYTTIIPVESEYSGTGRWLQETRNILDDLETQHPSKRNNQLRLKKIRVRADTIDSSTFAESGLQWIRLIGTSGE